MEYKDGRSGPDGAGKIIMVLCAKKKNNPSLMKKTEIESLFLYTFSLYSISTKKQYGVE